MRLRACMGGLLLLCGACAQLPEKVRVEVDGHSIEVKKRAAEERERAPGR